MNRKISLLLTILLIFTGINVSAAKMYALDGREADVHPDDVQAWKNVGWYTVPVMKVYALDGREVVIAKTDYAAWNSVGWYDTPSVIVYAPDGRTAVIAKTLLPSWQSVGWYDRPVMIVYAPDGRTAVIYKSDYPAWNAVGWVDKTLDMIYSGTVNSLYNKWKRVWSSAYPTYCYYDIDKDGTPELVFDNGLYEAGRFYEIYTYKNENVQYVGEIGGSHTAVASVPNKNGLLLMWGHMGYESASTFQLIGGNFYETTILDGRESQDYAKPWELIPGSVYLDMKYVVTPSWAY